MAGPWEQYASPTDAGPWANYAPAPSPDAAPQVGGTWTDAGGNAFEVIAGDQFRKPGQLTVADILARQKVQGPPISPPVIAGPTEISELPEGASAAQAAATRDPLFVKGQIDREPVTSGGRDALRLMGQARGREQGPLRTFIGEAANTALLNAPRFIDSLVSSIRTGMPLSAEHDMQKASDAMAAAQNPTSARAGQAMGIAAQMLGTPQAAIATPARSTLYGALMGGAPTAFETRGDLKETARDTLTGALMGQATARAFGTPKDAMVRPARGVTIDQLREGKNAAYRAVDDIGAVYTPDAFADLVRGLKDDASAAMVNPLRHPSATSVLDDIAKLQGKPKSLTELDQLRQVVRRDVANHKDDAQAFFGQRMIKNFDEFIGSATPAQMASGDPTKAADAIRAARASNTRYAKAEAIDDAISSAESRAASTGSGGNQNNALRQEVRKVRDRMMNATPDEQTLMNEIIFGTPAQEATRLVGKLSPSGNGLMAALNVGAVMNNPTMAAPGLIGTLAKSYSDAMTRRKVNTLFDLMAAGGDKAAISPKAALAASIAGQPQQLDQSRLLALLLMGPEGQKLIAAPSQ